MKQTQLAFDKIRVFSEYEITDIYSPCHGQFTKGLGDVRLILEHSPQGEGDKWFYVVEFSDGTVRYIFDVTNATKRLRRNRTWIRNKLQQLKEQK